MNKQKLNLYYRLGIIGFGALFLVVIAYELTRDYKLVAVMETTPSTRTESVDKKNKKTFPLIAEYDVIIERPLFSENRKPFVPEKVAAQPVPQRHASSPRTARQDEYSLSAVIITNDKKLALIETRNGKKLERLKEGENIGGWTLAEVEPSRVSLIRGNEEKILELTVKPSNPQISQDGPPDSPAKVPEQDENEENSSPEVVEAVKK